jgi:signal transduction histidine kinase
VELLKRYAALFMRAPMAIAVQRGPELVYELANPVYTDFLGGRQVIGKKLREVLPDYASLVGILEQVLENQQAFEGKEFPFRIDPRGDGSWEQGYFNMLCEPLGDGVITFGVDVTEHVLARGRVEGLVTELSQAVRARDDFLSIASHELKTPLTPIQLQVQILRKQLERAQQATIEVAHVEPRLQAIERNIDRLTQLINTLLDISRITAARLDLALADVDLGEVVRDVVARAGDAITASRSEVTLEGSGPVVGHWDRLRLDQIVTNLISNAIKYGAGKPITVRVERAGGQARLIVRDQGIGIAPADQKRIFERFERAVSTRSYGGFGLGLWIVHQLVAALGGTIQVESAPGAGATFTVELPVQS